MKAKPQIFIIHGGQTFRHRKEYLKYLETRPVSLQKSQDWKREYLDKELGKKFEIIRPDFPLADNAVYSDWKIHFERYIPLLRNNLVLIGNSLGGIFLAQYLSENTFPKKIKAVFLVAPPFDDTCFSGALVGGFKLGKDLSLFARQTKKITLFFSKDDDAIPVTHSEKYKQALTSADIIVFKSKNGHFRIARFPEIVTMIKALYYGNGSQ
ncbi:MAG: alpha/beta hydrolase [Candidatus Pacebacteria bacterium]|nr:alpha/beta hydrolase [Candidatus Paceibacterota bacterium]